MTIAGIRRSEIARVRTADAFLSSAVVPAFLIFSG